MSAIEKGCEAIGGGCFWVEFWKSYESIANFIAHDGFRNGALVVAAIVTLFIAIKRLKIADEDKRTSIRQAEMNEAGLNIDRFQNGAAMLGEDKLAVSQAGIIVLEELMNQDKSNYFHQIRKLLSIFIDDSSVRYKTGNSFLKNRSYPRVELDCLSAFYTLCRMNSVRSELEPTGLEIITLRNIYLFKSSVSHYDLNRMRIIDATIRNCTFTGSNLTHIRAIQSDFSKSDFDSADFSNSTLREVNFLQANLKNVDFSEAEFISCRNLTYTQLSQAKNVDPEFLEELRLKELSEKETSSPED